MTMDSASEARSATGSIAELADCTGLELVARLADGSIRCGSAELPVRTHSRTEPFDASAIGCGPLLLISIKSDVVGDYCELEFAQTHALETPGGFEMCWQPPSQAA
ncbi:hypothetical protein [Mesorhizobium sp. f-mel]